MAIVLRYAPITAASHGLSLALTVQGSTLFFARASRPSTEADGLHMAGMGAEYLSDVADILGAKVEVSL